MIVALGGSIFGTCNRGNAAQQQQQEQKESPIGTAGSTPIYLSAVNLAVDEIRKQQMQFGGLRPEMEGEAYGNALFNVVETAYAAEVARKAGIKPSEEEMIGLFKNSLDKQVESLRFQLITQKKLKPDATSADFENVFKKEAGKTVQEAKDQALQGFKDALQDPAKRNQVEVDAALTIYGQRLKNELKFTDADLKMARDNLVVKRIFTKDPAKMAKAQEMLKSGKPFETAMETYSEDPPEPKKALRDSTQNLPVAMVLGTKKAPLKDAKISTVNGPYVTEDGQALYLLVKRTVNPIKDFEKVKATIRDEVASQAGMQVRMEEIAEVRQGGVKWTDDGAKTLYEIYKESFRKGDQAQLARHEQVVSSPAGDSELMLKAQQIALSRLMKAWTPEDKKKKLDLILTAYSNILDRTESVAMRLELASLLIQAKDKRALDQLGAAINANGGFEMENQANFGNIATTLLTLKNSGIAAANEVAALQAKLDQWKKDKIAYDKDMATQKAEAEKAQKQLDEEQRKAAEEAKKKADQEKKAAAPPAGKAPLPSSKDLTGK